MLFFSAPGALLTSTDALLPCAGAVLAASEPSPPTPNISYIAFFMLLFLSMIFSVLPKSLRLICHAERETRSGNKNVTRPYSKNSRGSDLFPDNFTK